MSDRSLLQLVQGAAPRSIAELVEVMQAIDREIPSDDGLRWFHYLYRTVTTTVRDTPPAAGWENEAWLTRLDVVFGCYYLEAIEAFCGGARPLAKSWRALFEARRRPGVDRMQFALAGMNAHINHDLALALIDTNAEFGLNPGLDSPEHTDFERVNELLVAAMPKSLEMLATGLLGEIAQDAGKAGRLLAIWSVRAARDLAWDFSAHLSTMEGAQRAFALLAQDRVTGALGRSLLLRL